MRILLVEDSRINQMVATTVLSQMVGSIDIANNGAEAIEAVRDNDYDLILMDIAMPGMDGIEATRIIRSLPPPKGRIPIVAMTALDTAADRESCFAAGMDDYVTKPIDRNGIMRTLMRWSKSPVPAFAGHFPGTKCPGTSGTGAIEGSADLVGGDGLLPAAGGSDGNGTTEAAPRSAPVLDPTALEQLEANTDPSVVLELVKTFIIETIDRLERISHAVRTRDLAILEREAHSLKGSSGTFGARALQERAKAIELACKSGNADTAMALSGDIRRLAASAANAMVRHFQSGA